MCCGSHLQVLFVCCVLFRLLTVVSASPETPEESDVGVFSHTSAVGCWVWTEASVAVGDSGRMTGEQSMVWTWTLVRIS